jgi:hypothetical protein
MVSDDADRLHPVVLFAAGSEGAEALELNIYLVDAPEASIPF